jgi:hypothetical protein
MLSRLQAVPRAGKYCAYLLLFLMPGSFVVLPLWWLARTFRPLAARFAARSPASAARA